MNKIELIDRIALLEMLPQICDELNACAAPYNFDEHCMGCEVYMLHKMLTDMPTIDAAPVRRGEWEICWGGVLCCTVCGKSADDLIGGLEGANYIEEPNFCPNCGADMRGVSE